MKCKKKKYESFLYAHKDRKGLSRRIGVTCSVYKCTKCNCFHVGKPKLRR